MAGRTYSLVDQQDIVSPADSILSLEGSATVGCDIIYISFSTLGDELDDMIQWTVQRFDTSGGAGDSLSATAFNDNDIASQIIELGNLGTEPGYVAGQILLDVAVNTRSFQQWYAQPGREFRTAYGANEGIGVAPLHAAASTALCTMHYVE